MVRTVYMLSFVFVLTAGMAVAGGKPGTVPTGLRSTWTSPPRRTSRTGARKPGAQ